VTLRGTLARVRTDVPLAVLDVVLAVVAFFCVVALRFDGSIPDEAWRDLVVFAPICALVYLASGAAWGLYGPVWRHASAREARNVVLAGATGTAVLLAVSLTLPGDIVLPRSIVVLGGLLTTMLVGLVRFQARLFAIRRTPDVAGGLKVVLIGAGDAGAAMLREMRRSPNEGLVPVAVCDDDPRKHGRSLHGVPILCSIDDAPERLAAVDVQQVLLAIADADAVLIERASRTAESLQAPLKVLPRLSDVLHGNVSLRTVRDVRIEDLLGRKQVVTDLDSVHDLLAGKRVLITGGGGSIGSEIARQVASFDPAELVLLDHDETHLHDAVSAIDRPCTSELADIRDLAAVREVFELHRPEVVFHAAAHKHVPILEDHACEAITTNLTGTRNATIAAEAVGVERFVFISTDKAVHPASVMGASKRLGEQLVLRAAPEGTAYCAVRFGNVLGSRGSVIPTFRRQLQAGGPLTVTDARMTRFFMSIEEAVELVLQATVLSDGGEVFMLDMGEPVRIYDLAERMIRLSGYRPGKDIAIQITGMRPGEKLQEELHAEEEHPEPTIHPSIMRLQPTRLHPSILDLCVARLEELAGRHRHPAARSVLLELSRLPTEEGRQVIDLRRPATTVAP
jgi:FlaA1/EpsC-like NDP-sugar epimerase